MYFSTVGPPNTDIWAVPMTGDRAGAPWKYLDTPFHAAWGAISPDGRWVAYEGNESGRDEIYIRPFVTTDATTTPQWQVSKEGGIYPVWSPDRREVYYIAQRLR
jgi:Tol biopolymer transport system component